MTSLSVFFLVCCALVTLCPGGWVPVLCFIFTVKRICPSTFSTSLCIASHPVCEDTFESHSDKVAGNAQEDCRQASVSLLRWWFVDNKLVTLAGVLCLVQGCFSMQAVVARDWTLVILSHAWATSTTVLWYINLETFRRKLWKELRYCFVPVSSYLVPSHPALNQKAWVFLWVVTPVVQNKTAASTESLKCTSLRPKWALAGSQMWKLLTHL